MLNPTLCERCPALRGPLCVDMATEQRADLEAQVAPRRLAVREVLFGPGQWPSFIYILREGSLKLVREEGGGEGTVVEVCFPGDWIGLTALLAGERFTLRAEALEPSALCALPSSDLLRHFAQDPAFNRKVVSQISRKLDAARSLLLLRSHHDAASRLAGLLLSLDQRRDAEAPAGLAITKADLGQMIATAQETVFRLLTKFEKGGLIRREDRRIVLRDRAGLVKVAARPTNTGPQGLA
jgi:CRP-like cAMP-binding protein